MAPCRRRCWSRHTDDDARFQRLLGLNHPYGWGSEGPDITKMQIPTGWYD